LATLVVLVGVFAWVWISRSQTGDKEIQTLLAQGSYRLAKQKALALGPAFAKNQPILWARVLRLNGDLTEANEALRMAANRPGQERILELERALLRLENGEWTDNLELVFRLEAALPEESESIKEALVHSFLRQLQPGPAKQILDSWQKEPHGVRFHLESARHKEFMEDFSGCLEQLDQALELSPGQMEIQGWRGKVLLQVQKNQESLAALNEALAAIPGQSDWELAKAGALDNLGRQEEAKAVLHGLLLREPRLAQGWADLGKMELLDRKWDEARIALEKALNLEPANSTAAVNLRKTYFEMGMEKEAKELAQKLAKLETDQSRIRQLVQGDLQKRPNDPEICHELATLFLRTGYPKSAIFWCKKALALSPQHAPSHELIAGYYEATGNPGLAAEHRRKAQVQPKNETKGKSTKS